MSAAEDNDCDRCTAGCNVCNPLGGIYWPTPVPPKPGDAPLRVEFIDGWEWHYYSGFGWMEPLT